MASELIRQIDALLSLDAKGALAPHGIGGHARELLERCKVAMNTRPAPAATDTGLETVEWQRQSSFYADGWGPVDAAHAKKLAAAGEPVRELVTRSQAEELLAAKDAEIKGCNENINLKADFIEKTIGQLHEAEADNAAQAARVKELEGRLNTALAFSTNPTYALEALEAKLAAAEKALEPFADHANDQAVDDTGWRDKETVKIVVSIGDLRKARAVLRGKLS